MVERAALELAPFLDEVAFVGGATVALWITDQAAPEPRVTKDVDLVGVFGSPSIRAGSSVGPRISSAVASGSWSNSADASNAPGTLRPLDPLRGYPGRVVSTLIRASAWNFDASASRIAV